MPLILKAFENVLEATDTVEQDEKRAIAHLGEIGVNKSNLQSFLENIAEELSDVL